MRILFFTDNFPPEVNAPASRTYEHCIRWVKNGNSVVVVTCAPNFPHGVIYDGYKNKIIQTETVEGIKVIRVWSFMTANSGFLLRTLDYLSYMFMALLISPFLKKPDVVIGTSPQFFTVVAAYGASLMKRAPFVFELRDLWPESIVAVGAMRESVVISVFRRLEYFLYSRAKLIVALTHTFKSDIVNGGVDPAKVKVVTNGVDLNRFTPVARDKELAIKHGLDGKFVCGYVGTIGMAHGLETLLDAAALIEAKGITDVSIIIIGDGANKERLKQRASDMALASLTFIDSVEKAKVIKYWGLIDVSLVHLKRVDLFKTVLPSKIFEAMGMGIPLIHAVEGESAELVRRAESGICVPSEDPQKLADAILLLKSDKTLFNKLKKKSLRSASQYSRDKLASDLFASLEEVVGKH